MIYCQDAMMGQTLQADHPERVGRADFGLHVNKVTRHDSPRIPALNFKRLPYKAQCTMQCSVAEPQKGPDVVLSPETGIAHAAHWDP